MSENEGSAIPFGLKVMALIATSAGPFYLLVVPMLAALAPRAYGTLGVLFGAFMLAQLLIVVGFYSFESAAKLYNARSPRGLRMFQAIGERLFRLAPQRPKPRSGVLAPMLLSYNGLNYAFAVCYVFLSSLDPGAFSTGKSLGVVEGIYFSVITAATVGYGDISPSSDAARMLVILQVSVSLVYVITLFSAFSSHLADRSRTDARGQPDDVSDLRDRSKPYEEQTR